MIRPPFSDALMEHFLHPRNVGALDEPSGEGWSGSIARNRYMRIQVRCHGDEIVQASFGTYGCAPSIACGSCLTEWAQGRTSEEALLCTPRDVRKMLGGLPEGRRYCADLAVEALHAAVLDARRRREQDGHADGH